MTELFEHNRTAYDSAVKMLAERGKAAVIHPTGTGKSFIGFKLCEDNPDKTICWLSPSKYIFKTQLENLSEVCGYVPQNIKFYTYAKLMMLSDEQLSEIKPDYIILDEYHRVGAELWGRGVYHLLDTYKNVPVLGLSATAVRYLDGCRDMTDELFDGNVASEMTLGEAVVRGILNPPKYILSIFSYKNDLEKYERRVRSAKSKAVRDKAEIYLEYLRRALENAENLDDLFDHNITDRTGKYIVFCAGLEHMNEMIGKAREWFSRIDNEPHIYSVYSEDPAADKSFAEFKADDSHHLKLLYCIDALNEGVHIPDISGVILLRPTVSPIIYKQQIGRALSALKSKEPVIFDIVNNIENLYSIDSIKDEMSSAIRYFRDKDDCNHIVNENFEIVDKSVDCKEIFEKLDGILSAPWDVMFDLAKCYYIENGDLEIPANYFTCEGYSLGRWITNQRRIYNGSSGGVLTQEQIDKLDSIGMRWRSFNDISWEKYYSAAVRYNAEFGDLDVKTDYVDDNGVKLGQWLNNVKSSFRYDNTPNRRFTDEQIHLLRDIGFCFDTKYDIAWEEAFAELCRYKSEHGDINIRCDYVSESGIRLGEWLRRQKYEYFSLGRLSDERKNRLEEIGSVFENTDPWEVKFALAEKYFREHGNINVPAKAVIDGVWLSKWLNEQRLIGEGRRKKKLTDEQREKLLSIGMKFGSNLHDEVWFSHYDDVKNFYLKYGHIDVTKDVSDKRKSMMNWIVSQRRNRNLGKLSDEQIRLLDDIGMIWKNSAEAAWDNGIAHLREYYEKFGNAVIPEGYRCSDGYDLKSWINNVKYRYKHRNDISREQLDELKSFGVSFESYDDIWEKRFEQIRKYLAISGSERIPKKCISEDGCDLYEWVSQQKKRYRKSSLTSDRINKLTSIGIRLG